MLGRVPRYIPQSMWKAMRSELVDLVDSIPQGDVSDFRNFMGAVIDERAYTNHMTAIEYAKKSEKAKVIAGGKGDDKVGWFIRPTSSRRRTPTSSSCGRSSSDRS
jgi:1-pyrroline-5-carboxylate dehydrogenase